MFVCLNFIKAGYLRLRWTTRWGSNALLWSDLVGRIFIIISQSKSSFYTLPDLAGRWWRKGAVEELEDKLLNPIYDRSWTYFIYAKSTP